MKSLKKLESNQSLTKKEIMISLKSSENLKLNIKPVTMLDKAGIEEIPEEQNLFNLSK